MGVYLTNDRHVSWKSVTTTAWGAGQKCHGRVTLRRFTTSRLSKSSLMYHPLQGQHGCVSSERLKTSGQCSLGLNSLWFEALRDLIQAEQTGLSLRDKLQADRSLLCPNREPAQCKLVVGSGCAALDGTVLRTGWTSSGAALPVKPECGLAFVAAVSAEVLHGLEVARVGWGPSLSGTICPQLRSRKRWQKQAKTTVTPLLSLCTLMTASRSQLPQLVGMSRCVCLCQAHFCCYEGELISKGSG